MTREVLVRAFLEGASIATLAELLGHEATDLEAGLRQGLIEGIAEQDRPAVDAAPKGGDSSPRPARNHAAAMRLNPGRKRVAKAVAALDLTGYPAALQDPRAETQRDIYDSLKGRQQTTTQLSHALELDSGKIFQGIEKLREKNLVRGSEDTPVVWSLA